MLSVLEPIGKRPDGMTKIRHGQNTYKKNIFEAEPTKEYIAKNTGTGPLTADSHPSIGGVSAHSSAKSYIKH